MKTIKASVSFLLSLLIIFSLCSCSGADGSISSKINVSNESLSVSNENKSKRVYYQPSDKSSLKKVATAGLTALFYDEKTGSVSVYDISSKKLWNSLPEKYSSAKPCVISVDVVVDGKQYNLNSQDDSFALGLAETKIENGQIAITYKFDKTVSEKTKINFSVPVVFDIDDGLLSVNINTSEISTENCSSNVIIRNLRVLEYFGSSTQASDGDYIFVPESCGAILDISKKAKKFSPANICVYGNDAGKYSTESKYTAYLPAYGMKNGNGAYIALVEDGDAISTITVDKALEKEKYNRVGAFFELTPVLFEDEKAYVSRDTYSGNISISYRFLSGENTSYCAMASACREMLIRNGTLTMFSNKESNESIPFVLNLIGNAKFDSSKKTQTLTTLEQAEDILSLLRSKGLSNIILRYKGIFEGDNSNLKVSLSLGSKAEFENFTSFVDLQNIEFYPDATLFAGANQKYATSIKSGKATVKRTESSNNVMTSVSEKPLSRSNTLEENTNDLINGLSENAIKNVCLADAASVLYTDFSASTPLSKEVVKDRVSSLSASVSANKGLMLSGANIYAVKYADYICDMPFTSKLDSNELFTCVPFLQILFHGVIDYAVTPINLNSNAEYAMLKAAEYGAVPSFELYYSDLSTDEKEDNCYYMNEISSLQSAYERLNNTFESLQDKKITDHYKIKIGVWCTEYEGDINVYVNYTKKDVKVNGITVESMSFIKVG